MKKIALLGDSIFDNAAYIGGGIDVIGQLKEFLPDEWEAVLRAVDGSVVEDLSRQILDLPSDVTHLVVSVGGNNALMNSDILQMGISSSAEFLNNLADRIGTFEFHYRRMLESVLKLKKATALCTIYYPRMPEPLVQKISVAALAAFNDVIIRQTFLCGLPLIDLRLVCNEDSDYANEIEPSEKGGRKIAETIGRLVQGHDFSGLRTQVFF
ncbi:MAG: SGNH/GDSL hydrolase family protein [Pyrinomonadaceae bacterium]